MPCVGHVGVDVGEGQLHGLDHQVLRFRMIDGARGQVEMLQDAKRDQRRDALPVRRNLVQRVAAIGLADGRNPFRRVVPQVRQGQRGLVRLRVGHEFVGGLALIEIPARAGGDAAQGRRGALQHEVLADLGSATARHEVRGKAGLGLQDVGLRSPFALHDGCYGIAALGIF